MTLPRYIVPDSGDGPEGFTRYEDAFRRAKQVALAVPGVEIGVYLRIAEVKDTERLCFVLGPAADGVVVLGKQGNRYLLHPDDVPDEGAEIDFTKVIQCIEGSR